MGGYRGSSSATPRAKRRSDAASPAGCATRRDGHGRGRVRGRPRRCRGAGLVRPLGAGQRRHRPRRRRRGGARGAAALRGPLLSAAGRSRLDCACDGHSATRAEAERRPGGGRAASEKSAPAVTHAGGPDAVLWMQRTAGNAAVARTVARTATQSIQRCGPNCCSTLAAAAMRTTTRTSSMEEARARACCAPPSRAAPSEQGVTCTGKPEPLRLRRPASWKPPPRSATPASPCWPTACSSTGSSIDDPTAVELVRARVGGG